MNKIASKHGFDGFRAATSQETTSLKKDMDNLRAEIKQDIETFKTEIMSHLDKKIAETKTETIRWFLGSMAGMSVLIVGLSKVFL